MKVFYLSKSTSLYDLNLILNYRMFVVIWLFLAKRAPINFCGSHKDPETRVGNISIYLLGFRIQCDVKVNFQHDFKICGALSRFNYERLMSLFIVCRTMFNIGESRSVSQTTEREWQAQDNVTFNKWLEILAGEDLPSKLYCSGKRGLEIQREQRRRRVRISSGRWAREWMNTEIKRNGFEIHA